MKKDFFFVPWHMHYQKFSSSGCFKIVVFVKNGKAVTGRKEEKYWQLEGGQYIHVATQHCM